MTAMPRDHCAVAFGRWPPSRRPTPCGPAARVGGGCLPASGTLALSEDGVGGSVASVRMVSNSVHMKSTTTRGLREKLRATMARAAKGEDVLVTRRGKPYVRLVAAGVTGSTKAGHPLRGSVLHMADDFDAPLEELWSALET